MSAIPWFGTLFLPDPVCVGRQGPGLHAHAGPGAGATGRQVPALRRRGGQRYTAEAQGGEHPGRPQAHARAGEDRWHQLWEQRGNEQEQEREAEVFTLAIGVTGGRFCLETVRVQHQLEFHAIWLVMVAA